MTSELDPVDELDAIEMAQVAVEMDMVATYIEKFSALYSAMMPNLYPWSANQLRHEATVLRKAQP